MSDKYILSPKIYFTRKYIKIIKKNQKLVSGIEEVFNIMAEDPFDPKINTHKVHAKIGIEVYSSRVTGDIRIIWNFDQGKIKMIDLLDIGGHSGKNTVY